MTTLNNPQPVQCPGPYDKLLHQLQGNILKGHGRDFTVNIFLNFAADAPPRAIRDALRALATRYVVSAYDQLLEHDQLRRYGLPGGLFGNLFLSRRAYTKLGYDDQLEKWFRDPPVKNGGPPQFANFLTGMKGAADDFGDKTASPGDPLEQAYDNGQIDALLLLADDSESFLLRTAREEVTRLERGTVAKVVAVERGAVLRNNEGEGIEHFGYVDGRSQPLFLAADFSDLNADGSINLEETKEKIGRTASGDISLWNPFAELSLVLLKDPAVDEPDACGSYYVFRKLEQNVRGFLLAEQQLADVLGLEGAERDRAGAMAVGRFRDGTPLALSESTGFLPAKANNFRYDGLDAKFSPAPATPKDPFGLKCPFQAHIRKTNPRQNVEPDLSAKKIEEDARSDRARRIARRGIPYGERKTPDMSRGLEDVPAAGVGLLFACFQSSIMNQFAFIQAHWANNIIFPIAGPAANQTGLDAVIGQEGTSVGPGAGTLPQHWRKKYGGELVPEPKSRNELRVRDSHETSFRFSHFVKFRGGEFFFAPSLTFFLNTEYGPY